MNRLIGGQPLYTKNEFVFANASVLCVGNSAKAITYQIVSEHGNIGILKDFEVEEFFTLHSGTHEPLEPVVCNIDEGFALTVGKTHSENIKLLVPQNSYVFESSGLVGIFKVKQSEWNRFSELLCL
ncbi:hypothetical protein I4I80_02385 [Pseudomonas syringae pv. tomato]|nr:hypothetical protein [Pseudomonas syringae pv. tomato]MBW8023592.1 hypothetical protein [Pseudomonas syringae pv. tomato]